jgi:hypothetical protein
VAQVSACALTATPGAWGAAVLQEADVALVAGNAPERPRPVDVYLHPVGLTTSVSDEGALTLRPPSVHPNPFNPRATIGYEIPVECHVTLTVHNLQGRLVTKLVDCQVEAGPHTVGLDASGLASGVYFCRLCADGAAVGSKMILLK